MTDAKKIAAIALVMVSDRFLNAHAYLKDSAVTLRACHLVAEDEAHLAIRHALLQAKLKAEDLQIAQMLGGNSSPSKGRKSLGNHSLAKSTNSSPVTIPSLGGTGVTGWAGLCGLGERSAQVSGCVNFY